MNGAIATEPFEISSTIRADYLNLPRNLEDLSRIFGLCLNREHHRDATTLTLAIECTDRMLDALPQPEQRYRFSIAVVAYLSEGTVVDDLPSELCERLSGLREVGQSRGIHMPLCLMAFQLFENCEIMRTTKALDQFVGCAVREGRLMVEMLLLILGDAATPQFSAFMRRLAEPANLVDKLRDARRDFANGEIFVKPTTAFYARLAFELLKRTARLSPWVLFRWQLGAWGARSLFTELVRYFVPKWHSNVGKHRTCATLACQQAGEHIPQHI